jgi:LacI family transcriptional regulator
VDAVRKTLVNLRIALHDCFVMTGPMGRKRKSIELQYRKVALAIVAHDYSYQRRKIQGIIDYYSKHCAWEIHRNQLLQPFVMPEDLVEWNGDGIIGEIYSEADLDHLLSLGIPVVNTSSSDIARAVPSVSVDNQAVGCMAAEHLVECKLDRFAFVGPRGLCHVRERLEGFSQALEKSGGVCEELLFEPKTEIIKHESYEAIDPSYLMDAISSLEFPVGIMASSDRVGFSVLEACRKLGLRSPEDVALVGVDDDDIYCQLAYSTMTSIQPAAGQVGFAAAAMLDELMAGNTPENIRALVPPRKLVFRNSTDTTRSEYPEVARALRFIRNHSHEFIDVTNVLDVVPVSRRWLEMKFKAEVGHGIYQEIRRVHIDRAKELLETTEWPILRIARESGFNNTERFEFAFHKLLGMNASEYRKEWAKKAQRRS